jgi:hypothetical protein
VDDYILGNQLGKPANLAPYSVEMYGGHDPNRWELRRFSKYYTSHPRYFTEENTSSLYVHCITSESLPNILNPDFGGNSVLNQVLASEHRTYYFCLDKYVSSSEYHNDVLRVRDAAGNGHWWEFDEGDMGSCPAQPSPVPPELIAFPVIPPGYEGDLRENHPVMSAAAVCDLDNPAGGPYGDQEIVTLEFEGYLYAVHAGGTQRGRKDLTTNPNCGFIGSPAVGDLDNDGNLEIVVGTRSMYNDSYICVYDKDGNPKTGWPYSLGSETVNAPALADLTDDGTLEVVVASNNAASPLRAYYRVITYNGASSCFKSFDNYDFRFTPAVVWERSRCSWPRYVGL